jgi:hypothetical protein
MFSVGEGYRGKCVNSLFAVDPVQKGAVIVYRGFYANHDELLAFEQTFHKVLDTTWAIDAPLDSQGRKGVIFGQHGGTTNDPLACAHLLNAKYKSKGVTPNAHLGVLSVATARLSYPQLPVQFPDTARWPAVRIDTDIPVRGELIVRTYGPTYWRGGSKKKCRLTAEELQWFEVRRLR